MASRSAVRAFRFRCGPLFVGFNGYLLLGHYLSKHNNWSVARTLGERIVLFAIGCAITYKGFLMAQKIRISNPFWVNLFSQLTKYGFGIYMVHYFLVGPGWMIVDLLHLPIPIQIAGATSITFALAWMVTALVYKVLPTKAKWIMG